MTDISRILNCGEGERVETDQLLPLVYDELRRLAAQKLSGEAAGSSLQATALVHEAFLRLVGTEASKPVWDNRGHFFAAAAEAMRRILVDSARKRKAKKRGGGAVGSDADPNEIACPVNDEQVLAVHEVLDSLARVDADAAMIVKLRFFAGMNMSEAAVAMQISVRSAHNIWAYARAWLRSELGK